MKPQMRITRAFLTLAGYLLLAFGIGAGVILVLQPQLFKQGAATDYSNVGICGTGLNCSRVALSGGSSCKQNSTGEIIYCCPKGSTLSGTTCVSPTKVHCTSIANCASGYLCNPGTSTCESAVGSGNCAGNTGSCYVTSPIGLVDNHNGTYGAVCEYGGHWTTCSSGYVCNNYDCVPSGSTPKPATPRPATPPPTKAPTVAPTKIPTPTPTATPIARCLEVRIFTPSWTRIYSSTFFLLKPGSQVYFCVRGSATSGLFDKARFTINGVTRSETSLKRPNSTDFCDLYTIPSGVYSFDVQGEIHHVTLGWR